MALDLWPSIRLHGIRHFIKHHGDKHEGIKLINIKHLDLMLLGSRHLSISGLNNGLQRPSTLGWPQKVEADQHHNEPPIWMQNMMEWMMTSYQQPPIGR